MTELFFERPILNSPYDYPSRHWELDDTGQPTQKILDRRRAADFITPIPKPRKRKGAGDQTSLVFDEGKGLSSKDQQYSHTAVINAVRQEVDAWRRLPPSQWKVTPETARLLQHWRSHKFAGVRPFFCQVEAAETAIWLTEVAPQIGKAGDRFIEHLAKANTDANPELSRLALKLATGAGKTTVMAMLIAWQTVNAVRHPNSKKFTRGFLVVAPGLTIKDRLRVLHRCRHASRLAVRPGRHQPPSGSGFSSRASSFFVAATFVLGQRLRKRERLPHEGRQSKNQHGHDGHRAGAGHDACKGAQGVHLRSRSCVAADFSTWPSKHLERVILDEVNITPSKSDV